LDDVAGQNLGADVSIGGSPTAAGDAGESNQGGAEDRGTAVHGRVFYGYVPAAGFRVAVDGVLTTSDRDGYFSFENVGPTYQLVMIDDVNELVQVFDGFSERRPQLYAPPTENAPWAAHVQGVVSGSVFNYPAPDSPANHTTGTTIMFQPAQPSGLQILLSAWAPADLSPEFEFDAQWDTAPSRDGELLALEVNFDGDVRSLADSLRSSSR
jgi:hypothetical protein